MPHHHEAILGYCRDLGVPLQVMVNDNRHAFLHDADALGGRPERARRMINDTRGAVAELAARAVGPGLDRRLSEEDLALVRDFVRAYGELDENYRYRGSSRAGYAEPPGGPTPGRILEPLDLVDIAKGGLLPLAMLFGEIYEMQAPIMEPIGGMDAIAHAFYRRTRRFITLNAQVTRLRRLGCGARVTWRDRTTQRVRTWDADHVIVTVP
ncbi:FAD-dependent oxidoreductase [Spongiactinospora gelatinilytica]|uniref:FAD-dependent oxidoreductase n=1 Tax=Spongiactinospora gelatinilytica TaxID=2666298 RepID=UPI00227778DC|nr:FAD-dependent oxidoreductase [Spongiactinospora gelatinilytica]